MNGGTPDRVPFMLDLSHYYYHRFNKGWNIQNGYVKPETDLIDYHKKLGAGFYVPNQALMFGQKFNGNVNATVVNAAVDGRPEIRWRYETPLGAIERIRVWEEASYSWAIKKWGVATELDLKVLAYAMSNRTFEPLPENYAAWDDCIGDAGIAYLLPGYGAMGHIMHYWMGVENTVYACADMNFAMHEAVDQINESCMRIVDMLAGYPADAVLMGDNFSGDIQPPSFFNEWSAPFYKKAIDKIHSRGKKAAMHVDGKLRGAVSMVCDVGADIIDAVTPPPAGDLTPMECRREADLKIVLSGGVSPGLWLPSVPYEDFKRAVIEWLELRKTSPALIAAAGDQVPPGADEGRISAMRELVDEYGRY